MSTRIALSLFLSLVFCQNWLAAQCPITVNAGPDQYVCQAGGTATLLGSVSGTALGYSWTPTTGLSNPNILTPSVTITGPATYTLSAQAVDPSATNLVTNPAFELGNTGFTSQYSFNPLPITPGTYVLTTSPALVLSTFPPCDDHTFGNGTGYMMLVNGNASTGAQVWCQTIPVAQNTWYVMSGWVMASPLFPPTMQFSVNGVLVGDPYPASTGTCDWQQFSAAWFSGSATTAQLCVTDQISGGNGFLGDDYALDDIFFAPACTVTDQVSVGIVSVNASSPATAILLCNAVQTGIVLSGNGSSTGPGYTYQWDGPGVIAGGNSINATVNQEGLYTLTVSYDSGNGICTDQSTTLVLPDPNVVVGAAFGNGVLDCDNPTVSLDGTGSSVGSTISYNWQPAAGVVAGQGTLMPDVNQPGVYTLTVSNSISGCTATASVIVNQDIAQPSAAANAPTPISCADPQVLLSGSGSSTGPNFTYLWTGPGIVSGDDLLNGCTVNQPGQYVLTVTNNTNGCTATATATVTQDGSTPVAAAAANAPGSLDCDTPTLILNSTGSSTGPGISYAWTTMDGQFAGPTTGATATIDDGGTYLLTVTNSVGCTATASVTVAADFATPTVGIASPIPVINCLADSVQLDASQSSSGSGFGLVWATQNGNILSGSNMLMPWVGSAGIYTLTITNSANGCTASASATVTANTTPPIAQAGPNATLDCSGTAINLDGNGSSSGPNFTYQWTTAGGNIVSDDTTLSPEVNGVGQYFLMVENAANGCTAIDSVMVGQDVNAPTVVIAPPASLDCDTDEITLDATGSSSGANITLTWNGPSFVGGQNTLMPTVNAPGIYQLILLNQTNNCVANASVTVAIDTVAPVADAGAAPVLDCSVQSGTLDGSGSSQGPLFSYLWSNGDTILTPTISAPGTYTLTVTNSATSCTAADAVTVAPFGNLPDVDIATPDSLNCTITQIQLAATASNGAEFAYDWTFTGTGTGIVSGDTTLTPTVGSAGTYTLTVTNTTTNCSASESVQVAQSATLPTVDAGAPQTLLCGQTSLQLSGTGSSGVSYNWTTQNGNILSGEDTPSPTVNAPGTYTLTVTDAQSGCTASDDVVVGQDASAPVADAGAPQTLDCNTISVQLDGSASSGGAGITYLWTTVDGVISLGETTLTPTVTAAGTYLLTVTNTANNCQTLASVQVDLQNQQPDAIIALPQVLGCNNPTTTLNGTGSSVGPAFSYLWTGPGVLSGATTLMPVVNAPGVYTFAVTNGQTACVTFAQVTVVQDLTPPSALAAAPQPLTCTFGQVPLSGLGSSVGAGFTYQWQGPGIVSGGTTLAPIVDAPGLYQLTVTNQGNSCTATTSVVLTENITPPTAVAAATGSLDCNTVQATLDGTGSSTGAGFTYQWQGPGIVSGGTTLNPMVNAPGTYTLTVTNQANGCTATATAMMIQTLTAPVAVATASQPLTCALLTTSLDGTGSTTGAGITYQWQGPGIVGGGTTLQAFVNQPGAYFLTVSNVANGCAATVQVILNQDIAPPTAEAGPSLSLNCGQGSLSLQGGSTTPSATFSWASQTGSFQSGQDTPSPVVTAPGTYLLTVTNPSNGCTALDSTVVTEQPAIFPSPQFVVPNCQNPVGSISFDGGQGGATPFVYSIDGGASFTLNDIFENLQPADYEVLVQDANGCQTSYLVSIPPAQTLVVSLSASGTVDFGGSLQLSPVLNFSPDQVASIVWSPADGLSCTDCLEPMATPTQDVTYTVEVTSVDGCTGSASISLTVVLPKGDIYVPNAFSPNADGINDVFTLFANENEVTEIVSFRVFTRWGESVFEGFGLQPNDTTTGWDGTFRGKEVDLGVYAWFAEVEMATGERRVLKGEVTVVR